MTPRHKIEITYNDLFYILSASECQIREWYKKFEQKEDEIYLNKIESIIDEINNSPSTIFEINEGAE